MASEGPAQDLAEFLTWPARDEPRRSTLPLVFDEVGAVRLVLDEVPIDPNAIY